MALLRENRMLAVTDRSDQASARRSFSDSFQLYNKKFDKLFSFRRDVIRICYGNLITHGDFCALYITRKPAYDE
jgi:hypothetical protein